MEKGSSQFIPKEGKRNLALFDATVAGDADLGKG